MKLVIAAATDVGTVREANEDFFYYSKPGKLIVVCDGMGGHQSGALASRIAGKTMRDIFFHADFAELARLGEDAIDRLPPLALRLVIGARLANRRLLAMAGGDRQLHGMGTTLVAIAFGESGACVAHVGDSRLYRLRAAKLAALTEDHSLVNQLLQDRDIRQDQVKQFRKKNVLTRALGTHPTMKVDVQWFPVQASDLFLLCSDGFHNALNDEQIAALLRRKEPDLQKMADTMVQQAKAADGSDNITAVIAKIEKVSDNAEKKEQVKMTIAEEAARAVEFEDNFIQEKYFVEKAGRGFGQFKSKLAWWSSLGVLSVLMMAALVYAKLSRSWLFETPAAPVFIASPEATASNTALAQNSQTPNLKAPAVGGHFVFLQLRDAQQLEELRQQPDLRVIDHFDPDQPITTRSRHLRRQMLAGYYSLALFDSLQNFVYRRDNIRLRPLPVVSENAAADSASTARALPNETPPPLRNASPNSTHATTSAVPKDTLKPQQ
jgi:protein phosphatase